MLSLVAPYTAFASTCGDIKSAYQGSACCGESLSKETDIMVMSPPPPTMSFGTNPCDGAKPYHANTTGFPDPYYFNNVNCTLVDGVFAAEFVLEQSGANVTAGYVGAYDAGGREPITSSYFEEGLCPVNVHWHLGAEHLSVGQYDDDGVGPDYGDAIDEDVDIERRRRRKLAAAHPRQGGKCHYYDAADPMYTTPYDWKYCTSMAVGATYEVHWPHSAAGQCGTPWQYQSPFYDGVFCTAGIISLSPLNTWQKIGVEGQVFTIVNNESYYYPDLIRGAMKTGDMWSDVAYYTGSTTGTSRSNTVCSRYTPITWQVDRKCHLISASSFDKMCKDMLTQSDDMSGDVHPHGSREVVPDYLAADNMQRQRK